MKPQKIIPRNINMRLMKEPERFLIHQNFYLSVLGNTAENRALLMEIHRFFTDEKHETNT